jgi:capsular exopolysaccharide synthesis family protein
MSIVDAIERAKQLGKLRAAAEAGHQKRVPPQARAPVASPHATDPTQQTQPVAALEPLKLQRCDYVVSICERNRIIVPDVDENLSQHAAPPYRMLRTRILQRCRSNGWTTLAITSPGPGEGKSVTSLNLAISIAREGNQDVFLLDCDMRNPSLCRYLGVAPAVDLTRYFNGECAPEDVLFTIGVDRLTLAGSVAATDNASELLSTDRLETLLARIRRLSPSPLILLDLPPVVNTDDALVVAPRVDAIILVASEGLTRREGLDRAVALLADFPLAGVVLNRSNESIGSDYYGSA